MDAGAAGNLNPCEKEFEGFRVIGIVGVLGAVDTPVRRCGCREKGGSLEGSCMIGGYEPPISGECVAER